jgi:hypothetical protein
LFELKNDVTALDGDASGFDGIASRSGVTGILDFLARDAMASLGGMAL